MLECVLKTTNVNVRIYKQTPFHTMNLHSFRTPRFIHQLECEQPKWEEFRGVKRETGLLQIYVRTCPLCSEHSWTACLQYVAKWNGRLWIWTEFGVQMIAQVSCLWKKIHEFTCDLYLFMVLTALFLLVLITWTTGRSIFIMHRPHVHTPPVLLTPEIVTDLHGTLWALCATDFTNT